MSEADQVMQILVQVAILAAVLISVPAYLMCVAIGVFMLGYSLVSLVIEIVKGCYGK